MTYFTLEPKPKAFVHLNGVKAIKQVSYGAEAATLPMLKELCDDPILNWFEGSGFGTVEYDNE